MKRTPAVALTLILISLVLAACKRDEPAAPMPEAQAPPALTKSLTESQSEPETTGIRVTEVQMARVSGDNGEQTEPTQNFRPDDAVTAVVFTDGVGSQELGARWTYGAERLTVYEEQHRIETTGQGVHQFRISKADGFPAGHYRVDIQLDGETVTTRDFTIE